MSIELIKIYQDTKEMCSGIPSPYSEKRKLEKVYKKGTYSPRQGKIIVEPLDTVSALIKYSPMGRTAVLNMASEKRKGGGVENGRIAQEECLFRCSNLFTISDSFYPLDPLEYIYTYDATFIKDKYYGLITPIVCDVITMPAINLNKYEYSESLTLLKINGIINSAIENGCDNLILGAWGCGVFGNDPEIIANLFERALYRNDLYKFFKNIVFAVINDRNSVGNNYEIFKNFFNNI